VIKNNFIFNLSTHILIMLVNNFWNHLLLLSLANLQLFVISLNIVGFSEIVEDYVKFDLNQTARNDLLVFLHIQKTGGSTFGQHLVNNLLPCDCKRVKRSLNTKCDCIRPGGSGQWLFSRFSTGWRCGVHADWTELMGCVDPYMKSVEKSPVESWRYFYITFLRDPVDRYLSEWNHVSLGATWEPLKLECGGKAWGDLLPRCYGNKKDWKGVSLTEFMECPHNLAVNRMTRMLADLELEEINCYNKTVNIDTRDRQMLDSAKTNLVKMAFFGFSEEQERSQRLFEETFNLKFKVDFVKNKSSFGESHQPDVDIIQKIRELNHLDLELYKFAKNLFNQRLEQMNSKLKPAKVEMRTVDAFSALHQEL